MLTLVVLVWAEGRFWVLLSFRINFDVVSERNGRNGNQCWSFKAGVLTLELNASTR